MNPALKRSIRETAFTSAWFERADIARINRRVEREHGRANALPAQGGASGITLLHHLFNRSLGASIWKTVIAEGLAIICEDD